MSTEVDIHAMPAALPYAVYGKSGYEVVTGWGYLGSVSMGDLPIIEVMRAAGQIGGGIIISHDGTIEIVGTVKEGVKVYASDVTWYNVQGGLTYRWFLDGSGEVGTNEFIIPLGSAGKKLHYQVDGYSVDGLYGGFASPEVEIQEA